MAALLVSTLGARAQNLTVSASTVNHPGGYQVTCHGSNDGSISLNISGGVPPYSILWSNNSSANPLTGLAAGVYTATVTDSLNNTAQVQVTLLQPPALSATSSISNYNGFAISTFTKVDGQVQVHPQGGTPPYTVVWNDNFNGAVRDSLSAGTYSFTLSDVNGCSTTGSRTLNQPTALQVSVSQVQGTQCHDTQDGSALLNISGGVPPYSIGWDNGSFSEHPNNLNAGENHFIVRDANQARVESMVVIPQPTKMQLTLHASQYANGMNVSCYDCYNGSLTAQVIGGTAPYTYYWNEDTIAGSATLNNLNGGEQKLRIADANGCRTSHGANLRMPERSDWTMFGNTGSDPVTQFIGTSDSSDVVFKANGQEAMRIKSSSEIEFLGKLRMLQVEDINPFDVSRKLVLDADGNLKIMPSSTVMVEGPNFEPIGCDGCACLPRKDDNPGWGYSVNMMGGVPSIANQDDIVACPNTGNVGIGTYLPEANSKLDLIGDIAISGSRLHVGYDGKVGIGLSSPQFKLDVNGTLNATTYYKNGTELRSSEWNEGVNNNDIYFNSGNVGIGTNNPQARLHINDGVLKFSGWIDPWTEMQFSPRVQVPDGFCIATYDIPNHNIGLGFKEEGWFFIRSDKPLNNVSMTSDLKRVAVKISKDGDILARSVYINHIDYWSDYVFSKEHKLMEFDELKGFVVANKHLPGIPSEHELKEKGMDVTEMLRLQMEKIEELHLYVLKLNEENKLLMKKIEKLEETKR
jgi:hypothetical protein